MHTASDAEPFASFFGALNKRAYREYRQLVEELKVEWQQAQQRALWALLFVIAVAIVGTALVLAGHFVTAVLLTSPFALVLLGLAWRCCQKRQQYLREQAAFADTCQSFKSALLALRLDFLGGRWFVAIALRGGGIIWLFFEVEDGEELRSRLRRVNLEGRECYPELFWHPAASETDAQALWQKLMAALPTLGFAPTKHPDALVDALAKAEFWEGVVRGPE